MIAPRLLIGGGSHADIPMIRAAQARGWHVTTTGNRADDLGHAVSDTTVLADYSDPDAVLAVARRQGVQAICASANDFSALSCARVAEVLGLPGHDAPEVAEIIHHKDRWRAFALSNGVPSPQAIGCTSPEAAREAVRTLRMPVIVKPVDLSGGKGMRRVDDLASAASAIDEAFARGRSGRVVVEEFIEGTRHGYTAILRDRRVVFAAWDDEHYHLSPYLVSGASMPGQVPAAARARLRQACDAVAQTLSLVDGLFHVQLILRPDGEPVILEICRRPPGDLYVDLVSHAAGVPYGDWIVRPSLGLGLDDVAPVDALAPVTRHCLMAERAGRITHLPTDPVVDRWIVQRRVWARPGDTITDPGVDKAGIVMIRWPDHQTMRAEIDTVQARLAVPVTPGRGSAW